MSYLHTTQYLHLGLHMIVISNIWNFMIQKKCLKVILACLFNLNSTQNFKSTYVQEIHVLYINCPAVPNPAKISKFCVIKSSSTHDLYIMTLDRSVIYLLNFQYDWHFMLSKDVFNFCKTFRVHKVFLVGGWLFFHLSNKGDTIQGGTLFKGGHYSRGDIF